MRTIAITSGKGGVGKTNVSANLGIALADLGQKVVIFDADLSLANLDVVLGVKATYTLQNVLSGEKTLSEIIARGPGGIGFIAGGSGIDELVNLQGPQLDRFLSQLVQLEANTDFLIFDTGAGIDSNIMTFLQTSDEVILVTTPDPASITDAYATAKLLFSRLPNAVVRVVLNMVTDEPQAQAVFHKLRAVIHQFLGKTLIFGGYVRFDQGALEFIRKRTPFVLGDPNSKASQDIKALAASLMGEVFERTSETFFDKFRSLFGISLRKIA